MWPNAMTYGVGSPVAVSASVCGCGCGRAPRLDCAAGAAPLGPHGGAVGLCDLSGSAPPPARSRLRSGGGRGGGFPARPRSLRTPLAPGHGTRLNTLKCKVRCSVVAGSCHAGRGLLGRVAVARVVRGRWSTISIESQSNFDYVRSQNSISVLTSSHFGAQGGSSIEAIVKGV